MDRPLLKTSNKVSKVSQEQDALTLAAIQEAVRSISYGVVQIIIQDGKIVQIDKTEKMRLV